MRRDYQRLLRMAGEGDAEAARALRSEAERQQDPEGMALSIAHDEPGDAAWDQLCAALDRLEEGDPRLASLCDALEAPLSRWPDVIRVMPPRWWRARGRNERARPARLVRRLTLSLPGRADVLRLQRDVEMTTLCALEIKGFTRDQGALGVPGLLSDSPHLESIRALRLPGHGFTDAIIPALIAAPFFPALRELELTGTNLFDEGVADLLRAATSSLEALELESPWLSVETARRLAEATHVKGLRHLQLGAQLGAEGVAWLSRVPHLASLTSLNLTASQLDVRAIRLLAESQGLRALQTLTLSANPIGPEGAARLAGAPHLDALEALSLVGAGAGGEGVIALLESPARASLRSLDVDGAALHGGEPLGPDGARRLGEVERSTPLRSLGLPGHQLGDEGVAALLGAPWAKALTRLDLRDNRLGVEGVSVIARAPAPLQALWLSRNSIGSAGGGLLAGATFLSRLRALHLDHCALDDQAIRTLLGAFERSALETLDLAHNALSDATLSALRDTPALEGLRVLCLSNNQLSDAGLDDLAHAQGARGLRDLDLRNNRITDAGLETLARSPYLRHLHTLDLRGNEVTQAGVTTLRASRNLMSLTDLRWRRPAPRYFPVRRW